LNDARELIRSGRGERLVQLTGHSEGSSRAEGSLSARSADVPSAEESKAAKKFDVPVQAIRDAAARLFGTPDIVTERDRRAGDLHEVEPRSAQARRGHAMRRVLDDLAVELGRKKG
jgi:hypothetical protein